MVLRLIRKRRVAIIGGCPRVGAVAHITLLVGAEVILVLPNRLDTVMARRTRTQHLRVIDGEYRREYVCRMTVFADVGCLYVLLVLACRICSVVTADTIAGDIHVVEIGWQPANGAVTVVAVIATGDVRRMFASSSEAIMA